LDGISPLPRGVPQIEISYDIDSNGILNVSAIEKSSGKSQNITITNDKGRLSKEDIDRMVKEAEQFKEQDEEMKGKLEAKNSLENYLYQMKNSILDDKCTLSEKDKETVKSTVEEGIEWLNSHQNEDKKTYSDKQDEYTSKLSNLQPTGIPEGGNNFKPTKFEKEPSEPKSNVHIEEVD
jgi:L1 cell adhesion molecule like protein